MHHEDTFLEPLKPLFPAMTDWVEGAYADTARKFSVDEQIENGPSLMSHHINCRMKARMRQDPRVAAAFRPVTSGQLEFLAYEGDPFSIGVSLSKVVRHSNGRLRTCNSSTFQQQARRDGELLIGGINYYALVLGHIMGFKPDGSCQLEQVVIGRDSPDGFLWVHRLLERGTGERDGRFDLVDPKPTLPLFEPTRIVLRSRPDIAPEIDPSIVAHGAEERRRQAQENAAKDGERSSDQGA